MFRKLSGFLIAILLFLILVSCTKVIREDDLFAPQRYPVMTDSVNRQNVEIPVDNSIVLRGWFLTSEDYYRSMIYFYGNREAIVQVSPILYWLSTSFNMNVLAVDYRGYGFSDGYPELEAISSDVVYIYDYLMKNLGQKNKPVFIYGRSLGTIFALKLALQRPVGGIILQTPPTTITDVIKAWQRLIPWFLRWLVRLKPEKKLLDMHPQPVEDIQKLSAPLLVIHGAEDNIVPITLGRTMYENAGSLQKEWCKVEGSGHNDLQIFKGYTSECIRTFIDTYGDDK
jgi:pimeloyl-ACP methyl ester carboxylesterase